MDNSSGTSNQSNRTCILFKIIVVTCLREFCFRKVFLLLLTFSRVCSTCSRHFNPPRRSYFFLKLVNSKRMLSLKAFLSNEGITRSTDEDFLFETCFHFIWIRRIKRTKFLCYIEMSSTHFFLEWSTARFRNSLFLKNQTSCRTAISFWWYLKNTRKK